MAQTTRARNEPDHFFQLRAVRGAAVLNVETSAQCQLLLDEGHSIAATARLAGIQDTTLCKAIAAGRIIKPDTTRQTAAPTTKSQRSRTDAQAAAAIGLADSATTRFEPATDLALGGVLGGLSALRANGLFSGLDRHLTLPKDYYSAQHILCVLGFMALARVPEVRTLREKFARMAATGDPRQRMRDLSKTWMENDPAEAAYLYLDGHVRVYHGSDAKLPRRYVSRQKLCLRGTTDYWINDALGRPFFVVSKAVTDGLAADPLLHRFIVIFDRESSHHSLLSKLWEQHVGVCHPWQKPSPTPSK